MTHGRSDSDMMISNGTILKNAKRLNDLSIFIRKPTYAIDITYFISVLSHNLFSEITPDC